MTDENEFDLELKQSFKLFSNQFITASQDTPGMMMMSIDEIGEWILGATGTDISNYDLNTLLTNNGYSKTTVSNTIMWMVCQVE